MNGFIYLEKKMLDWEWYQDVNVKVVFIHLLLKANWEDVKWRGIDIKRGQLITSLPKLSEELNLSVMEIRTALRKLVSTGEINRQTTNRYTLITLNNYDIYQTKVTDKQQTKQQTDNRLLTDYQQTMNKEKEYNKDNLFIVERFVERLNQKTGKHFSPKTESTIKSVNGRVLDGYTLDDFLKVVDVKCAEWLGTDMEKYLTPDTLLRPSKFEKYLNQKMPDQKQDVMAMAAEMKDEMEAKYGRKDS